jgi:hypothetical protein
MLKALDIAAGMSGCGTPLPTGEARVIALEERGAEGNGSATINAMVHTISVSREGKVRLERRRAFLWAGRRPVSDKCGIVARTAARGERVRSARHPLRTRPEAARSLPVDADAFGYLFDADDEPERRLHPDASRACATAGRIACRDASRAQWAG